MSPLSMAPAGLLLTLLLNGPACLPGTQGSLMVQPCLGSLRCSSQRLPTYPFPLACLLGYNVAWWVNSILYI